MALHKVAHGLIGGYAKFFIKDVDGETAALVYVDPYQRWHVTKPDYLFAAADGRTFTETELEAFLLSNVEGLA